MKKSYDDIKMNDTEYNDEDNTDNDEHVKNFDKLDKNTITRGVDHVQRALFTTLPESHNLMVYSDIRVLRATYPAYIKSLLEGNEIVLILTYYDHPSMVKQILRLDGSKKNSHVDIEKYLNDGSLVIVDSLMTHFNPGRNNQINNNDNNDYNDGNDKANFLSLIRILFNHGVKSNKKGIAILSDMGSFFHDGNGHHHQYNNNNDNNNSIIYNILKYERSIPAKYRDLELKNFCLYHQKDYELHFASKHQKTQLLDCHSRSILIMNGSNNNHNNGHTD
ncbi:MAG TPA: hypothetical protein VH796_14235 [Nitrososphaeraceae archaeon]|jgi:hypothetical protein